MPRLFLRAIVLALAVFAALPGLARATASIPLQAGDNQGTADGFVGTQNWTVDAAPGALQILIAKGQNPSNTPYGAPFHVVLTVKPTAQKAHLHFKEIPGGYSFYGTVSARTHLTLSVIPPASTLVRTAMTYVITPSGNLVYGTAAGGDPIVGAYMSTTSGIGAVKFLPGGKVVASDGDNGTWTLFDAGTHLYAVTLGQTKYTVKLVPGQGLLSNNGNIEFQTVH